MLHRFHKLAIEDPSFTVKYNEELGDTIISGMGELHLEVLIERLRSEHKLNVIVGEPSVAFRETITKEVQHTYRYKKQTGGKGQFAHIVFRLEPNDKPGNILAKKVAQQVLFVNPIEDENVDLAAESEEPVLR